jgi:hypothetical protein
MKVLILGANLGLEAAVKAAMAHTDNVMINPNNHNTLCYNSRRFELSARNLEDEIKMLEDEECPIQEPPPGRSAKNHNLLLAMNKRRF